MFSLEEFSRAKAASSFKKVLRQEVTEQTRQPGALIEPALLGVGALDKERSASGGAGAFYLARLVLFDSFYIKTIAVRLNFKDLI
ncbi:hypothetical protein ACMA1I_12670 [Pontibacter sp. 13R65]|uniref:hypothetical protein n=1 Tax=Pontibacter sp. 13R65 TaxID=3127458 RepID=UPI00301D2277